MGWTGAETAAAGAANGSAGPDGAPLSTRRTRLAEFGSAAVEAFSAGGSPGLPGPEGFSPQFQVARPYRGMLLWHVGSAAAVGDANQVLFVRGGESYRLSHPRPSGYSELIVTPALPVLAEVARTSGARLASHPLFLRRSRRAEPRLQSLRVRLLHTLVPGRAADGLAGEELVLALLREAFAAGGPNGRPAGTTTARLVRRVKEFLEAEYANPVRLADVGRAVGASPAYLTDVFRRVEGTSLHRYLVQLRLARALVELPHADDLTTLALDVGFSSHSHFSDAFRRSFGCTPSEFRRSAAGKGPQAARGRLLLA
jgi:AraC-like DNA-binding protein